MKCFPFLFLSFVITSAKSSEPHSIIYEKDNSSSLTNDSDVISNSEPSSSYNLTSENDQPSEKNCTKLPSFPGLFKNETPETQTFPLNNLMNIFWNYFFRQLPRSRFHSPVPDSDFVDQLPPNYRNSSSTVQDFNGSKFLVNQTMHKKSSDGFVQFYHVKEIHPLPEDLHQNETVPDTKSESELQESSISSFGSEGNPNGKTDLHRLTSHPEESVSDFDVEENVIPDEVSDSYINKPKVKRSIKGNRPQSINFPPKDINRFGQSFVNNPNIKPEHLKRLIDAKPNGKSGQSRSYVYKNIGGKPLMYIIDHNEVEEIGTDPNNKGLVDSNVKVTEGGLRAPDLSRDTAVNPNGKSSHQGLTMVDPDAEVFDFDLVLKEIDSRPQK